MNEPTELKPFPHDIDCLCLDCSNQSTLEMIETQEQAQNTRAPIAQAEKVVFERYVIDGEKMHVETPTPTLAKAPDAIAQAQGGADVERITEAVISIIWNNSKLGKAELFRPQLLGLIKDALTPLAAENARLTRQAEEYRQETHRWDEAHRGVEAGELKRLAERFNCAPEHAVTAALSFATTADGVMDSLRAELAKAKEDGERLVSAIRNYVTAKRHSCPDCRSGNPCDDSVQNSTAAWSQLVSAAISQRQANE